LTERQPAPGQAARGGTPGCHQDLGFRSADIDKILVANLAACQWVLSI
jgi:hypothetical protein